MCDEATLCVMFEVVGVSGENIFEWRQVGDFFKMWG